jgi:hypothetical protein
MVIISLPLRDDLNFLVAATVLFKVFKVVLWVAGAVKESSTLIGRACFLL